MTSRRRGFNSGIKLPTLIEHLKSILDQYPDDGQILKELVQNADDAGARTVKFLWDESEYPAHNIYRREHTSQFQGPSLLAYNDASFDDEDMDGILMIQNSVKRGDALKVGRFGLGFKSVFHMTDLVGLVTKYGVAFLDPHEELYLENRDSGRSTSSYLWDPETELDDMMRYSDQWLPFYHDIFQYDKSVLEDGRQSSYGGTIFRFPFRKRASELSTKVYTPTEVARLLDSLMKEGHLYLLFLKSIESIEFYRKSKGAAKPTLVFRTSIVERDRVRVKKARSDFFSSAKRFVSTSAVYKCDITTEVYGGIRRQDKTFSYLIGLQMDYGGKMAAYSRSLSYLPMMGAALSLNGPDLEVSSGGQLFCFLPLPLEKYSPTGMNVHVHGYFALDQNRRHLKRPSAEQEDHVVDEQLIWNVLLIRVLLPKCLVSLVTKAAQDLVIDALQVYELFPVSSLMRSSLWRNVVPAFYAHLNALAVFQSSTGRLVRSKDAVFQEEGDDRERPLLRKVVAAAGYNCVVVPTDVLLELEEEIGVCTLDAQLVSKSVKKVQDTLTDAKRCQLLGYFLRQKDAATLLIGLELFPLENGAWGALSRHPSDRIYLDKSGKGKQILGTSSVKFIRVEELEKVASNAVALVANLARSDTVYLKIFNKADMAKELRKQMGSGNSHVLRRIQHRPEWFRSLWDYIGTHFYSDLDDLEGLHIVNVERNASEMCLTSSTVIVCTANATERKLFEALGVTVISDLPDYFRRHAQRRNYVLDSTDVAKVLMKQYALLKSSRKTLRGFFDAMSSDIRQQWRAFLAKQSTKDILAIKTIVKTLPIFETVANSGGYASCFVSASEVDVGLRGFSLPGKLPDKTIRLDDDSSERLARLLEVQEHSMAEVLDKKILPNLKQPMYTKAQIEEVVRYCIENSSLRKECSGILVKLSGIAFVSDKAGKMRKPSDFLDPAVPQLSKLFKDLDVFPVGTFTGNFLSFLRDHCGLRSDINNNELLMVAQYIHSNREREEIIDRAKHLLKYLERNQHLKLDTIRNFAWIPVLHSRPHGYPAELPWASNKYFTATEASVVFEDMAFSCGSVRPCCQQSSILQGNDPSLEEIVHHFVTIRPFVTPKTEGLINILRNIYEHLSKNDIDLVLEEFERQGLFNWVWNGSKFVDSAKIVMNLPDDLNLSPYVFKLPHEFVSLEKFFLEMNCLREHSNDFLIGIFQQIYNQGQGSRIDDDSLRVVQQVAAFLCKEEQITGKMETEQDIFLPTKDRVMMHVSDLCINECPWISDKDMNVCDPSIPSLHAYYLGVKTNKEELIDKHRVPFGIPFGQHEELISRIQRILQGYPRGSSIMKELLQNADDSGASELHFVIDKRTHSGDKIFSPEWKNLQGPALLVYNDSSFTQEDIEGIQALGEGSKSKDIIKTGQYGVGFNAVYHVTDTPTFMTDCNGLKLCALDPQTKSVRGSTKTLPGQMFEVSGIRDAFPDVVKCYTDLGFDLTGGTLFRLPLRTAELAASSLINPQKCEVQDIENILKTFAHEAEESLLFVRNVKKICFSTLDVNNKTTLMFECAAERSSGQKENEDFWKYAESTMKDLKAKDINLEDVECKIATSTITLSKRTSENNAFIMKSQQINVPSTWLIIQQFGFRSHDDVAPDIIAMLNNDNIHLSVMGGIAYRLDTPQAEHKLFCFLPLPVKVPFAFHINGHFALNYETRDDLMAKEKNPAQAKWNDTILALIIAPSVVKLLQTMRDNISSYSRERINWEIKNYLKIFPSAASKKDKFSALPEAVFMQIYNESLALLPMIKEGSKTVELLWLPPDKDEQGNTVFFDNIILPANLSEKELQTKQQNVDNIRKSLKGFGMNLLLYGYPMRSIHNSFEVLLKNAIHEISPEAAYKFLQCVSEEGFLQRPLPIEETPYKSVESLISVCNYILDYVKPDGKEESCKSLEKLPILLRNDNVLHLYESRGVFFEGSDLFPHSPEKFLHKDLREILLHEAKSFAQLSLTGLADILLPEELQLPLMKSKKLYFMKARKVNFFAKFTNGKAQDGREVIMLENGPTLQLDWFQDIWRLMGELVEGEVKSHRKSCEKCRNEQECHLANEGAYMEPIGDWCLYPCVEGERLVLIQIRAAKRVIADSYLLSQKKINEALSKMNVMRTCSSQFLDVRLYEKLHGSIDDPISVIFSLKETLSENESVCLLVAEKHCEDLIHYFAYYLESISTVAYSREVLTRLPIYPSIEGPVAASLRKLVIVPLKIANFVNLEKLALVISNSFGSEAFISWQKEFIELYQFLHFRELSVEEFYKKYILPNFYLFEWVEQWKHLEFWQRCVEKVLRLETEAVEKNTHKSSGDFRKIEAKKQRIINILAGQKMFLNKITNVYQCAEELFSPSQTLFVSFCKENIPQERYKQFDRLLSFLRMCNEVTDCHIVKFAREIEKRLGEDVEVKRLALVEYLYDLRSVPNEVKSIYFLTASHSKLKEALMSDESLEEFCCFSGSAAPDIQALIWSQCSILDKSLVPPTDANKAALNMITEPNLSQISSHIQTVCQLMSEIGLDESLISLYAKELKTIFEYCEAKRSIEEIKQLNFIPVSDNSGSWILAAPGNILLNSHDEQEESLFPYLATFKHVHSAVKDYCFLSRLGAPDKMNPSSCLKVLNAIAVSAAGHTIDDPNELNKISVAYSTLIELLQKGAFEAVPGMAFLLGSDDRMHPANELTLIDVPQHRGRIPETDATVVFLRGLNESTADQKETNAFGKLPERLRPKLLSSHLRELPDDNLEDTMESETAREVKEKLRSLDFAASLFRIVQRNYKQMLSIEDLENRVSLIQNALVRTVWQLRVRIMYEEDEMSTFKPPFFIEKGENDIVVILDSAFTGSTAFWSELTDELTKHFSLDQKHARHLQTILSMKPDESASDYLEEKFGRLDNFETIVLPSCGSEVPLFQHRLLYPGLDVRPVVGHFVAIEKATAYIFGKVLERIDEGSGDMDDIYVLDIGESEPKECRPSEIFTIQKDPTSCVERDLEDILISVGSIMEEAYQSGNGELRESVFLRLAQCYEPSRFEKEEHKLKAGQIQSFLKCERERLDEEYQVVADIEDLFGKAKSLAQAQLDQLAAVQDASYSEAISRPPRGDEDSAQSYLEQAEHDLEAVRNDLNGALASRSYCWACYKCHASAEKALKAVLLKDDDTLNREHYLPLIAKDDLHQSLARELEGLVRSHVRMRYPSIGYGSKPPAALYDHEDAKRALELATGIVKRARELLPPKSKKPIQHWDSLNFE